MNEFFCVFYTDPESMDTKPQTRAKKILPRRLTSDIKIFPKQMKGLKIGSLPQNAGRYGSEPEILC